MPSADAKQEQRRADQEGRCPGFQPLVDHVLDDLRHHQRKAGHAQQEDDVEQDLPDIGFEVNA